jgi:hypothetical protein
MTEHRIDLRPDLRPNGRRCGPMPMFYQGKDIGSSNTPIFAAARWLLENNAAFPDDTIATYRGGNRPCLSGKVGEMAKWTVEENDSGNPSLRLRHWKAFPAGTGAPKTAETGSERGEMARQGEAGKTMTRAPAM